MPQPRAANCSRVNRWRRCFCLAIHIPARCSLVRDSLEVTASRSYSDPGTPEAHRDLDDASNTCAGHAGFAALQVGGAPGRRLALPDRASS